MKPSLVVEWKVERKNFIVSQARRDHEAVLRWVGWKQSKVQWNSTATKRGLRAKKFNEFIFFIIAMHIYENLCLRHPYKAHSTLKTIPRPTITVSNEKKVIIGEKSMFFIKKSLKSRMNSTVKCVAMFCNPPTHGPTKVVHLFCCYFLFISVWFDVGRHIETSLHSFSFDHIPLCVCFRLSWRDFFHNQGHCPFNICLETPSVWLWFFQGSVIIDRI